MLALDPRVFRDGGGDEGGKGDSAAAVHGEELFARIMGGSDGVDAVRLPGDRRYKHRVETLEEGREVEVPDFLYQEILAYNAQ